MIAELESESLREFSSVQGAVAWSDILDRCEIVEDDAMGAPWKEHDEWEHELVDDPSNGEASGSVRHGWGRERVVLTDCESWGNFEGFRSSGASKQVAAELTAYIHHQAREKIADWHNNGWTWYGVKCEMHGEHASVWGIDCEDYAREYVRKEIASEMAHLLEKAGYFISGRPEEKSKAYYPARYLERKKDRNTEGVNAQNWRGPVRRFKR
jgi:hypothetical protein